MPPTAPWHIRVLFRFLTIRRSTIFCAIFAVALAVAVVESIVARRLDPSLYPALLLFAIAYAARQRTLRRAA